MGEVTGETVGEGGDVEMGGDVGRATGTTGAEVGEKMGGEEAHALPSLHSPSSPQTAPGLQLKKRFVFLREDEKKEGRSFLTSQHWTCNQNRHWRRSGC